MARTRIEMPKGKTYKFQHGGLQEKKTKTKKTRKTKKVVHKKIKKTNPTVEPMYTRSDLVVELGHPNRDRPTEWVFYDTEKKEEVCAVLKSEVEMHGVESYYDQSNYDNYALYSKLLAAHRFKKFGYVGMNDGYDAFEMFDKFYALIDDVEAFHALEEKYSSC